MAALTPPADRAQSGRAVSPTFPLVRYVPSTPSRTHAAEGIWRFRASLPDLPAITLGAGVGVWAAGAAGAVAAIGAGATVGSTGLGAGFGIALGMV